MSRPSSYNRPWGHGADPDQMGGESASADQSVITAGWVGRVNAVPPTARMQNYWQARVDLGLQEIERQGFLSWRVDVPYTVGAMVSYAGNFFQALSANSGIAPQGSKDVGIWSLIRPGKWPTSTDSITGVLQVDKGGTGRRDGIHWMHVLGRPTTRDGYGIIDVPTKDEVDTALIKKADKATTLAGYGITDAMTPLRVFQAIAKLFIQATTTAAGKARIATQTEVDNSNGTDTIVTPQTLGKKFTDCFKQATETVLGFARVATQSQTNSGVDDTTFVTPKKFSAGLAALIVQATTVIPGIARIATQTEVDNSTGANLIVTPATMGQKFTDYFKQATVTSLGVAKVATQTLVNAGTDAITFVTPATLRFGVAYSMTLQGYIILPSWLGGFAIQWGSVASAGTVNFPTAFTAAYIAIASSSANGNYASTGSLTATSFVLSNSGNQAMTWLALGRV